MDQVQRRASLARLLATVLCALALEAVAQSRPQSLTIDGARVAASELSGRAVAEVQRLDFGAYKGGAGVLIAEGDSWFDYPFYDVLQNLEGIYQYKVESTAHKGDTLESMVYDQNQLSGLALKMSRLSSQGIQPIAILLSGGGNDISGPELALLLNHASSGLDQLNERIVSGVIDVRVFASYITFVQAVNNLSTHYFKRPVPILVHGYDYPVPDGRGFLGGYGFLPGPWFKPYFEQKGYMDISANFATLRSLVDRFNSILERLPKDYPNVCYVKVVGTLSSSLSEPRRYDNDWGNELHPTRSGFRRVSAEFQKALDNCAKKQ